MTNGDEPSLGASPSETPETAPTAPREVAEAAEPALPPFLDAAPEAEAPASPFSPGYQEPAYVRGWLSTPAGRVPRVHTRLGWADRTARWKIRWGLRVPDRAVPPGLYAVGSPYEDAPVLVTANSRLSFDALRSQLTDFDAWLLVVDAGGKDVWSAASAGAFGADEVARRARVAGLDKLVSHRFLTLPQLSAAGVTAEEVRRGCGFAVVFGPVRASDVKAFVAAGNVAEPGMRQVSFPFRDRLELVPGELVQKAGPSRWIVPALLVAGGVGPGLFSFGGALSRGVGAVLAYALGVLAGSVATPLLLPRLPGRAFSYKGAVAGLAAALAAGLWFWSRLGWSDLFALVPAVAVTSSVCAMLFTGATPFTSPSGVEKEMKQALKYQVGGLLFAALLWIGSRF